MPKAVENERPLLTFATYMALANTAVSLPAQGEAALARLRKMSDLGLIFEGPKGPQIASDGTELLRQFTIGLCAWPETGRAAELGATPAVSSLDEFLVLRELLTRPGRIEVLSLRESLRCVSTASATRKLATLGYVRWSQQLAALELTAKGRSAWLTTNNFATKATARGVHALGAVDGPNNSLTKLVLLAALAGHESGLAVLSSASIRGLSLVFQPQSFETTTVQTSVNALIAAGYLEGLSESSVVGPENPLVTSRIGRAVLRFGLGMVEHFARGEVQRVVGREAESGILTPDERPLVSLIKSGDGTLQAPALAPHILLGLGSLYLAGELAKPEPYVVTHVDLVKRSKTVSPLELTIMRYRVLTSLTAHESGVQKLRATGLAVSRNLFCPMAVIVRV